MKYIKFCVLIISFAFSGLCCERKIESFEVNINNEGNKINQSVVQNRYVQYTTLINNLDIEELKNVWVMTEEDLTVEIYERKNDPNFIRELDLEALNDKSFLTLLKADINGNGKENISAICIEPTRSYSYLVILEEISENNYQYITHLKFNYYKIFIFGGLKTPPSYYKKIVLFYQGGSSWGETVSWDGEKYILLPDDPYGA